jgi:hypothetical protein
VADVSRDANDLVRRIGTVGAGWISSVDIARASSSSSTSSAASIWIEANDDCEHLRLVAAITPIKRWKKVTVGADHLMDDHHHFIITPTTNLLFVYLYHVAWSCLIPCALKSWFSTNGGILLLK